MYCFRQRIDAQEYACYFKYFFTESSNSEKYKDCVLKKNSAEKLLIYDTNNPWLINDGYNVSPFCAKFSDFHYASYYPEYFYFFPKNFNRYDYVKYVIHTNYNTIPIVHDKLNFCCDKAKLFVLFSTILRSNLDSNGVNILAANPVNSFFVRITPLDFLSILWHLKNIDIKEQNPIASIVYKSIFLIKNYLIHKVCSLGKTENDQIQNIQSELALPYKLDIDINNFESETNLQKFEKLEDYFSYERLVYKLDYLYNQIPVLRNAFSKFLHSIIFLKKLSMLPFRKEIIAEMLDFAFVKEGFKEKEYSSCKVRFANAKIRFDGEKDIDFFDRIIKYINNAYIDIYLDWNEVYECKFNKNLNRFCEIFDPIKTLTGNMYFNGTSFLDKNPEVKSLLVSNIVFEDFLNQKGIFAGSMPTFVPNVKLN